MKARREEGEESSGTVTVGQGVKVARESQYLTSSETTTINKHYTQPFKQPLSVRGSNFGAHKTISKKDELWVWS